MAEQGRCCFWGWAGLLLLLLLQQQTGGCSQA
jgi:hypothetical protein